MTLSDFSESRFLKQDDCDPPLLATIESMEKTNVARDGESQRIKVVIHFEEDIKPFICNKTNAKLIAEFLGPNPDDWIGKQIVLYKNDTVMFGHTRTGGIRVRAPRKKPHRPVKIEEATSEDDEEIPY
jgi:hypothetical protein